MTIMSLSDDVMTPVEIADELGVSVESVYKAIRTGELPAVRLGRRWILMRSRVAEVLRGVQQGAA